MRIFLSWSGEQSRAVAKAFFDWLPGVIQQIEPWISTDGIAKGETWLSGIRDALSASNGVGLFFLTKEALASSWLLYEAGGIAAIGQQRVCTVCIDVAPHELKPPLGFFHSTILEKADLFKLVQSLNGYCQPPLTSVVLHKSFEHAWPELESALASARRPYPAPKAEAVDQASMTGEVLDALRRIEGRIGSVEQQQRRQSATFEKLHTPAVFQFSDPAKANLSGGLLSLPTLTAGGGHSAVLREVTDAAVSKWLATAGPIPFVPPAEN